MKLKVTNYNALVFRVTTTSVNMDYQIALKDYDSNSWKEIMSATDSSTWTGGQFWNMTDRWEDFYQTQSLASHGNLFLAIDRIAFETRLFPINPNLPEAFTTFLGNETSTQLLVGDLTTGLAGWIKSD